MSFDPGDAGRLAYPAALADHRADIDGPSLTWACSGVACPGDGARGVGVDGHMAEVGFLEPREHLCRDLCVEGGLLSAGVAGSLRDGGPAPLSSRVTTQPSPTASQKGPSAQAWHFSPSPLVFY
jgi:hypothetical protein